MRRNSLKERKTLTQSEKRVSYIHNSTRETIWQPPNE